MLSMKTAPNHPGARSTRLEKDEIEDFARTEIMTQDRKIAEMSGKPRGNIKELVRSS
jgi:hypothetical protein